MLTLLLQIRLTRQHWCLHYTLTISSNLHWFFLVENYAIFLKYIQLDASHSYINVIFLLHYLMLLDAKCKSWLSDFGHLKCVCLIIVLKPMDHLLDFNWKKSTKKGIINFKYGISLNKTCNKEGGYLSSRIRLVYRRMSADT